jgi:tRNA (guanine9-N1)-methyltransferase
MHYVVAHNRRKELISTVQQIARSYSANRYAPSRFDLRLTSLKGPIETVFEKHFPAFQNWAVDIHAEDLLSVKTSRATHKTWVYLTADSPNTLSTLRKDSVYIIGGIVDKNRHKGLCLETAEALGLSHAKFPIDDILAVKARRVLTINQVVEIMVGVLNNGGDWKSALLESIPKRKGAEEIDQAERTGGGISEEEIPKELQSSGDEDYRDQQEPDSSKGINIPTTHSE